MSSNVTAVFGKHVFQETLDWVREKHPPTNKERGSGRFRVKQSEHFEIISEKAIPPNPVCRPLQNQCRSSLQPLSL
jgi:hypothetical protein